MKNSKQRFLPISINVFISWWAIIPCILLFILTILSMAAISVVLDNAGTNPGLMDYMLILSPVLPVIWLITIIFTKKKPVVMKEVLAMLLISFLIFISLSLLL